MNKALISYIQSIQPHLGQEQLNLIASHFTFTQYQKNELLVKEGQVSDFYCFLEAGLIRSYTINTEGEEITTGIFSGNSIVCELMSFFTRIPSPENYISISACKAWCISFDSVQKAFHSMPEFREMGRAILVNEYAKLKIRTLSVLHQTAEERYAELIARNQDIFIHLPLKYIASYLGVTDSSLSRIRKDFSRK